ncbi:uncharacterized protein LOC114119632 isoform X3 [Aphis gossypii]|nr:uncharacterized protein LOC114119632 isoform X3 [Aphis gossypii]
MTNDAPVTSAESGSSNNSNDDVVIGRESSDVGAERTVTRRHPKIGFAPQNFDVPGPMKIYHLLHFIGAANGLIVGKIVESYKSLVPMTGLPVTTDFLVDRLRLSQKKVLSLVLAIIHDPEVIILDDITTGMDTVTLKNIWTLLTYINLSRECTIIVSASNNFCFMETAVTHVGILKNGKIITEGATTNLMEQFKTSSIEDLFIAIIFAEDNLQKNPVSLKRTRRLSINNNYIPHQYTSLLSSTFNTQLDESKKPKSVLQALILKNIWTLTGIYSILFAAFICVILFPLAAHWSFTAYPNKEVPIMVHNEDLGDYNNETIEPMSNIFISQLANVFPVMYTSKPINDTHEDKDYYYDMFECLLYFDQNYTVALRRRIERKIKNNVDFDNSQIIITMNMTDGRTAAIIKDQLMELYKQFLSDYSHNMLTEYVTDINDDSIKYNSTTNDNDYKYPIYGRFVNSGLIVILTFFFHGAIAVQLQQVTGKDCYYDGWTSYHARLIVQIPIAIVWNVCTVVHMCILYDILSPHYHYVFLGLLFVSVSGIHLGYILCSVVKSHFCAIIILYLKFTICVYVSGLWWPTCKFFDWNYEVVGPISAGVCFVRNLIEKQNFDIKSLIITTCWSLILVIITIVDIATSKHEKRYNKFKNLL